MIREIQCVGAAALKLPHRFILLGDPNIGELFIKCYCDWQTAYFGVSKGDVTDLIEKAILSHNASPSGFLETGG